jgi:hypothetical protein
MTTDKKKCLDSLRRAMLIALLASAASGAAQEAVKTAESSSQHPTEKSASDPVQELREQVRVLQALVAEMRSDWQRSRAETAALRSEIEALRPGPAPRHAMLSVALAQTTSGYPSAAQTPASENPRADESDDGQPARHRVSLEEEYELLSGKVDDQYQTKVESASKYRLRLSGIVLMNLVSNQGVVDSIDLPTLAYARQPGDPGGSFGATLRQSEIGFEAFGPTVAGAKTRADLQIDLAGGFPSVPNGINSGLMRLRTGTIRMDWKNTSIVAGQDGIFFSPNSPTSFASLAVPALSGAGNLWSWVPQVRAEHRFVLGETSSVLLQGGILDPVSGEVPSTGTYRQAGAGESSRQPAYASRIAWTQNLFGQSLRLGLGGFYTRQDYGYQRVLDGWAGTADIELPLGHQFSLGGKLYRGKGLGGLYGAIGRSAVFSGDPTQPDTAVRGLHSVGGWGQLKYRPANRLEFNAAFGMDNPYATDLKFFPYATYWNTSYTRNRGSFANMIYRPRSDLLFSVEYRRLTTYTISKGGNSAGHLNLMMGVLF